MVNILTRCMVIKPSPCPCTLTFPLRACSLLLAGRGLNTPLPDIPPGALPELQTLFLEFRELRTTLPTSWGAFPGTLPQLQQLTLLVQIEGPLPPEWAAGFCQLTRLVLTSVPPGLNATSAALHPAYMPLGEAILHAAASPASAPRVGAAGCLPPQWAAGFNKLQMLHISNMELTGPLPASWLNEGFPNLSIL